MSISRSQFIILQAKLMEKTQMEIDFNKIRQDKVKNFIIKFGLDSLPGWLRIKAFCYDPTQEASYRKHFQSFIIRKDIEAVWKAYITIHPKEAWNGEMVSFGVQFSKQSNSINYLTDAYLGMEEGQIIILNLSLLWGLINIAVGHKVAEINEQDRLIKLCYLQGGASEGSQWIRLYETPEGFTKVDHLTLYKSNSKFRDTVLYPRFHTKAITEFHDNVKQKAELVVD